MNQSPFAALTGLDTSYLDDAYADDSETAAVVFEQYLEDLPANMNRITDSLEKMDAQAFRQHIHKQKPGFSYVGLTDVTALFNQLEEKCQTPEDLKTYRSEIDAALARIHAVTSLISKALITLQSLKRA